MCPWCHTCVQCLDCQAFQIQHPVDQVRIEASVVLEQGKLGRATKTRTTFMIVLRRSAEDDEEIKSNDTIRSLMQRDVVRLLRCVCAGSGACVCALGWCGTVCAWLCVVVNVCLCLGCVVLSMVVCCALDCVMVCVVL